MKPHRERGSSKTCTYCITMNITRVILMVLSPSGHQVTLMWESVIKFQQMQSSRYGQTLSLQVWLTACLPIVGRLEYGLLSEHAHKHTYVCDSSQTPGTMNNDVCPNNTCYIVLLCMSMHVKQGILLTLGAHARGLRYLVCLSLCVCVCVSVCLP